MEKNILEVAPSIKTAIVQSISDAVGDKIKEDIRQNELKTQNSTPVRIWDHIYTGLCRHFVSPDCMVYPAKRGRWKMICLFEKQTGFIYSIMREKRFSEIHANMGKRKNMHYIDMMARYYNSDLIAPVGQTSLFQTHFDNEDRLSEAVQALLANLLEDGAIVRRHVLVLFESSQYTLTSIRAVMLDTNLDIVYEQNWNNVISIDESVVTEQVEAPNHPANTPTRGLKLTAKATARKKSSPLRQEEEKRETQ